MKRKMFHFLVAVMLGIIALCYPPGQVYAKELPPYYLTKEVTKAKDQSDEGLCWAFAVTSALETELIKNNQVNKDLDLSELALAYFSYNVAYDKLGQYVSIKPEGNDYLTGASDWFAATRLSSGMSPIDEERVPYSSKDEGFVMDNELGYSDSYYLNEAQYLYEPSRNEIKYAIQKYGSVTASFDTNREFYYYDEVKASWYNDTYGDAVHAICIVGWDDNYSNNNFRSKPNSNGAWIVKNSWGDEWGDNGFFYLSYEDKSIANVFVTFDMENGATYDNIYQNTFSHCFYFNEEGDILNGSRMGGTLANVFTAKANPDGAEKLVAIGFETFAAGNYDIKIYKNLNDIANPTSGKLADTLIGELKYAGFYRLELKTPLYLSEGESYAIVFQMKDSIGNDIGVATGGIASNSCAIMGQSYFSTDYGEHWNDYAIYYGENLAIKAFTNNCKSDSTIDKTRIFAKQPDFSEAMTADNVGSVSLNFVDVSSTIISWEEINSVAYFIYKYDESSRTWTYVDYTYDTSYEITGLKGKTEYKYGVKAYKKTTPLGTSALAGTVSKEYSIIDFTTAASKGTTISITKTINSNKLSWNKESGANNYVVYRLSPESDYEWVELATIKKGTSYTDKTAKQGLTYLYRVYAYKSEKLLSKGNVLIIK